MVRVFGASVSQARQDSLDESFAVLVSDPSLSRVSRTSAWTLNVVAFEEGEEARIQANLCDMGLNVCAGESALSLLLAGPLDKDTHFSELADLNGFAGNTRLELSYANNLTDQTGAPGFSGRVSIGQRNFDFLDPATLAPSAEEHAVWGLEGGMGAKWPNRSILASYRYEDSYGAPDAQDICRPASFGPAGTQVCGEAVVGAPTNTTKHVLQLEAAQVFARSGAVRLTVAHDLESDVTAVNIPIYVIPDTKGALGGGLSLGYRSDTGRITASFFVSVFKL
ncbi:MAG TPA: hypothetical protein VEW03_10650 [Longimicrobiaceae bacterium]|nr:hypothetical protein [Longimicrobiaceae bacterium]